MSRGRFWARWMADACADVTIMPPSSMAINVSRTWGAIVFCSATELEAIRHAAHQSMNRAKFYCTSALLVTLVNESNILLHRV